MVYQEENAFEVKDKIKENPIAILPLGAVETHGPHLPLGTDNFLAERLGKKLAEKVSGHLLPTLPYGQVWSLQDFPGSIHIQNESLISILYDIGCSLAKQGFELMVIVNGHLGNGTAIKEASRQLYSDVSQLSTLSFFYPGTKEVIAEERETAQAHHTYFHAEEIETSFMLHLAGEYVQMDKAICDIPDIPDDIDFTPTPWHEFTQTGVLGDATLATEAKGARIIDTALQEMVRVIDQWKKNRRSSSC